jgi:hypothetical protein
MHACLNAVVKLQAFNIDLMFSPSPLPPPSSSLRAVFTEAEIRASLVFQLSKLSSMLIKVGGGWVLCGHVAVCCVGVSLCHRTF